MQKRALQWPQNPTTTRSGYMQYSDQLVIRGADDPLADLIGSSKNDYWIWIARWNTSQHSSKSPELIEFLTKTAGWTQAPIQRELILESQLYEVMTLKNRKKKYDDNERATYLYRDDLDER